MKTIPEIDYSSLDVPEVLERLFHPRPEFGGSGSKTGQDVLIPVDPGIVVGARFHLTSKSAANLLFFHGNGEIVADYDELAPLYQNLGINFLPVDYRGYGRSTGRPTVTAMRRDAHRIMDFVAGWLRDRGYSGPLVVMGRSLGSAPAIELTATYTGRLAGLIVESGFAYAGPLLQLLGVDLDALGCQAEPGLGNLEKMRHVFQPTLIIHAADDHLIPFADGQALYDACPAAHKTLLQIRGANHNNLFLVGCSAYLAAIKTLVNLIAGRDDG
jgi:fermentation-respiration switch protein FrsA (DUF1100 family)